MSDNHKRVRLVREGAVGLTLGDTEHVFNLSEARAISSALQSEAFFADETQALRREIWRLREAIGTALGFYQVTHIHAELREALEERP